MKDSTIYRRTLLYGIILAAVVVSFPIWAMKKPVGILDNSIPGNTDLLYFAIDAPDTFIVYSPGEHDTKQILTASERMSDMVVSRDGRSVWTATKSGFVDMYDLPVGSDPGLATARGHSRIAPVLSSIALSANERFVAVGYGNSEDYNSRNVKILPAQSISLDDEVADFAVSGDIQDIVANPVFGFFYIINSHSDRVRIYNVDRFRLESDIIELGNSPGAFVVRPDGLRAFGAMNARKAIAVVNLETNETSEYIGIGFPPYAVAFNPDGKRLYIASRDSNAIAVMDTETNEILTTFMLPPRIAGLLEFNFPEIIAISSDEKYMYVMPKRPELVIYDISMVLDPSRADETPIMVQSEILASEPFYMSVVRNQDQAVPEG